MASSSRQIQEARFAIRFQTSWQILHTGDDCISTADAASATNEKASAASLEELHGALVPFSGAPRRERAEVASPAGLRIFLSGVESIFS